jgi:hypothetical protein
MVRLSNCVADGDWKVQILTTDSATKGIVALVVYGDQGCSGPIILGDSQKGLFQQGNIDEFQVRPRTYCSNFVEETDRHNLVKFFSL